LEKELKATDNGSTRLKICVSDDNNGKLKDILKDRHISICTTTNLRRIIKTEDIPENTVIIDDSRPEAISRDAGHNKIVLEGGLMKIRGIDIDYNFGFGINENVFGCLAESYALALDALKTLRPTLGDVDLTNYEHMRNFCLDNEMECGDFKSRDLTISEDLIKKIVSSKNRQRQGTKWILQQ
jgi:predicted amino acid dehydrogenase